MRSGLLGLGALYKVFALSAVLTFALASAAFADQVTNRIDTSPDTALENATLDEGSTQTVAFRVVAKNGDDENGCNIDAGEQLKVRVLSADASTAKVSPQMLTFTACNEDVSVTLTAAARGTTAVTAALAPGAGSNTTGTGIYDYTPASFTATVDNVPPTISDITNRSTDEDTSTGAIPFTVGDAGTPAGNLAVAGGSSNASLVPNSNITFGGSGANRTVNVTSLPNKSGTATITVSADDGAATTTDTFVLTVNAVNDSPNAVDDAANADEGGSNVTINALANDTDIDGDTLTITGNTRPPAGEGSVTCSSSNCTFAPDADFNGTTGFTYATSDGNGGTDTATVTVNVTATDDAPEADDDSYGVDEDDALNVGAPGVLENDTDLDDLLGPLTALTAAVVDGPDNGTLTLDANGSFAYAPDANFNGSDSFTYEVCDDAPVPLCDVGTANIAVTAVDDAPTISGVADTTTDEDTDTGALPFTVNDVDTAVGGLTVTASSSNTTLVPNANVVFGGSGANRTVNVTPVADRSGVAEISLTVSDGRLEATEAFLLTVRDATAPDTTLDSAPSEFAGENSASFSFSSEAGATFECSLDGGAYEPCVSPKNYSGLAQGEHAFRVRAIDAEGNAEASPVNHIWMVDSVAPAGTVSVNGGASYTNRAQVVLALGSSDPSPGSGIASMRFGGNPGAWSSWEPYAAGKSWTLGAGDGEKVIFVQFKDLAGNRATARATITLDSLSPTVGRVTPRNGARPSARTAVTASFSEAINPATLDESTVRLVNTATEKPVAATVSYNPVAKKVILKPDQKLLSGATYTVTILGGANGVGDLAGNTLTVSKVWRFRIR